MDKSEAKKEMERGLLQAIKAMGQESLSPEDFTALRKITNELEDTRGLVDEDKISLVWCSEDVIDRAEQDDIEITTQEARQVLWLVKKHYDCSTGVSWETLDFWINDVTKK